jgi:uncharacterized protein YggE
MLAEILLPAIPFAAICLSAVVGISTITFRAVGLIKKKTEDKGASSCPGFNADTYVTKEVCEQTRRTMHAEMKIISQEVKHTNKTLERVEKTQNEKLEQVITLIKKNGN